MKAIQILEHGGDPRLVEIDRPVPGPDEVLVEVGACGLNFADILLIKGTYQETPALPVTLGMEVAGRIVETGSDSTSGRIGTHVVSYCGHGGLAEFVVVPLHSCIELPRTMPMTDAAGFLIAYGSSHVALDHRARLRPGETLLVLGAAGGVGLTAVEIGKLMGARVIAAARGKDRLKIAERAGADHLVDTTTEDIREAVLALGGADVVYDPVGGDAFTAAMRATRPDGRILLIGFASGELPDIKANHVLVKNISLIGVNWGAYRHFAPDVMARSIDALLTWYSDGLLSPHIDEVLEFERALEGLDRLRGRRATGKIVVTTEGIAKT